MPCKASFSTLRSRTRWSRATRIIANTKNVANTENDEDTVACRSASRHGDSQNVEHQETTARASLHAASGLDPSYALQPSHGVWSVTAFCLRGRVLQGFWRSGQQLGLIDHIFLSCHRVAYLVKFRFRACGAAMFSRASDMPLGVAECPIWYCFLFRRQAQEAMLLCFMHMFRRI